MMRILQITPTYFSEKSIIGGGERYVNNVCAAVASATPEGSVACDMLSFGSRAQTLSLFPGCNFLITPGNPAELSSCAGEAMEEILSRYDVVHVHQCLTAWGIFVAARARLAGALVIGSDLGGGEIPALEAYPVVTDVFDIFHALSEFAATAFQGFPVPCRVILGPVNETFFPLEDAPRDRTRLITLGRILPHKGFEHAIAALPDRATLAIVGRNYDKDYLSFLKEKSQGKNVEFHQDASDDKLKEILKRSSLILHTGVHVGYRNNFYAKPELLSLAPLEAMCTGIPAIVSQAGSLPELAALPGCLAFRDLPELSTLLQQHLAGELFALPPAEIRDSTVRKYGLQQFGHSYLNMITTALADRS